jgi:hypothetical protein
MKTFGTSRPPLLVLLALVAGSSGLRPATAAAQAVPTLSDSARVSLISILPGEDLYSLFGHSALRVRDPALGLDVAYNFGTFDFGDSPLAMVEFVGLFTYGELNYRLDAQDGGRMIAWYWQERRRPAIGQTLDLTRDEAQELFRRLQVNALPENMYYRYDFFFDNCATRLLDVLEGVVGPALRFEAEPPGRSFRRLLDPYLTGNPWVDFGMDLGLGMPADRTATARESTFLPEHLMEYVATGTLDRGDGARRSLVRHTTTLTGPPDASWTSATALPWPKILGWGLLAVGAVLTLLDARAGRKVRRAFDVTLYAVLGVAGLAIVFLWFISLHTVTKTNLNLFWALPTHLGVALALARGVAGRRAGVYLAATAAIAALLLAGMPFWPQELPGPVVPLLLLIIVRSAWLAWARLSRPVSRP